MSPTRFRDDCQAPPGDRQSPLFSTWLPNLVLVAREEIQDREILIFALKWYVASIDLHMLSSLIVFIFFANIFIWLFREFFDGSSDLSDWENRRISVTRDIRHNYARTATRIRPESVPEGGWGPFQIRISRDQKSADGSDKLSNLWIGDGASVNPCYRPNLSIVSEKGRRTNEDRTR